VLPLPCLRASTFSACKKLYEDPNQFRIIMPSLFPQIGDKCQLHPRTTRMHIAYPDNKSKPLKLRFPWLCRPGTSPHFGCRFNCIRFVSFSVAFLVDGSRSLLFIHNEAQFFGRILSSFRKKPSCHPNRLGYASRRPFSTQLLGYLETAAIHSKIDWQGIVPLWLKHINHFVKKITKNVGSHQCHHSTCGGWTNTFQILGEIFEGCLN